MKNSHKIISVILFTAVIMVALGLARCPIQPNEAIGQLSNHEENLRFHKKTIRALLCEYREYSAECFPDSIEFSPPNIFLRLDPTLPGFMQFLEEKYK